MTKARKPGQWREIAAGRAHKARELRSGRGLTNIPKLTDVGSAAYRRLLDALKKKGHG